MNTKNITPISSAKSRALGISLGVFAAGLAFTLSVAAASAEQFEPRTQAGVGLFDQGGELHGAAKRDHTRTTRSYGYPNNVSDETVGSITSRDERWSAVPADNRRNEPGQGMFDGQR
jgi:hypothetical protein